jgi:tetratricopeptide (TPR) repeat protein
MGDQAQDGPDFFISYTGADRNWAEWIAWQLEAAGHTTRVQAWDFQAGGDFVHQMEQALRDAKRLLVVLSPAYRASQFGEAEWRPVFAKDPSGELGLLIPVQVQACDPPELLRARVYVDLVGLPEPEATQRLLAAVRGAERPGRPTTAPPYPGTAVPAAPTGMTVPPPFPGPGPSISNLASRNPNFTGRDELLEQLEERLAGGVAAVVAAYGLGGVGKTQLALEYAHRHASDYELVWWVAAESRLLASSGLAELAPRLGLPAQTDQAEHVAAVLAELARRDRWLLIFDNAEDPTDLDGLWPAGGGGRVLVTSRNPAWGGHAAKLPIDVLAEQEAVTFLLARTGSSDRQAAKELATELGGLPLALEQAAAYLEETGLELGEYLARYRRNHAMLLARGRPTRYPATVATTWQLNLEQVAAASPAAVELVRLGALLAPETMPLELLTAKPDVLPMALAAAVRQESVLDDAVRTLLRYSLVTRDYGGIRLHRLVQAVIYDGLESEERRWLAGAAVRLVAAGFPERADDLFSWHECQRLLPHALKTALGSVDLDVEYQTSAALLNRVALYLWAKADVHQARELLERSSATMGHRLEPEHVATSLSTQGKVLRELGDLAGAKRAHEQALALRESQLPADHPDIAWSLGNLGKVLRNLGDLAGAKRAHERAVALLEAKLGPDQPDLAWALSNLGRTLMDLGDLDGATHVHQRALQIRESRLKPNHPDVAWSSRNLGDTLMALGRHGEARAYYGWALAVFQARFGPDHPEVETTERRLQALSEKFGESHQRPDTGFEILFDGVDLSPWKMAGPGRFNIFGDGILETEGGMGMLWYTKRQLRDFVLWVDWMATSPDDNSGIFVRFHDPGNDPMVAVDHGYEIQIDDRPKSKYPGSKSQTGAIYGFAAPSEAAAKPVGEWNAYEIRVIGQRYTVILNGRKVISEFQGDRGTEGYVGLQNHHEGSHVLFRNIRIKEI